MTTPTTETPIFDGCSCNDPATDLLRDLIRAGIDHRDACLIAFGHTPAPTSQAAAWKAWARLEARRIANNTRRQLGLRQLPAVDLAWTRP